MGGIRGTLAMLMHTSNVGIVIDLEKIPRPPDVSWEKWLISFSSFGYLFTCKEKDIAKTKHLFHSAGISCEAIGMINSGTELTFTYKDEEINIELKRHTDQQICPISGGTQKPSSGA